MMAVIILFAFALSLVINFVERLINPGKDDYKESETNEHLVVEKSE